MTRRVTSRNLTPRRPGARVVAALAALCALAACSTSGGHSDERMESLLDVKSLIYGAEIGAWQHDGGPAVDPATGIPAETVAAGIPVIRFAVPDCFTDERCGTNHHRGTVRRSDFEHAVRGITTTDHAVLWLKLVPISAELNDGSVFCPPWKGDARGNLPFYKAELAETRAAGYQGPLIIELNSEMDNACWRTWRTQGAPITSAGSIGVSRRIGEHYAANAPALRAYAKSLGFSQVVIGAYIGPGGGPGWGQPCVQDWAEPYGYECAYQARWIDEFNLAVKRSGVAPPDFESIHAYPHSADFATPPYAFDDNIAYAYYRNWIIRSREQVEAIWGAVAGDAIRFSISEWNAGYAGSEDRWSGWTTAGEPEAFYRGWLHMLAGDGMLTGIGTRYWSANVFLIASNHDDGSGGFYNIIRQNGSLPGWYDTFKAISTTDPLRETGA